MVGTKKIPDKIPRKNRIRQGSLLATIIIYAVVILFCLIAAYPMYYVLIRSISDPAQAMKTDIKFFPVGFNLDLYKPIVADMNMWKAYALTIFYTIGNTVLVVLTSIMAAYPLASPKLKFRKFMSLFLIIPLYFTGGLIPTFLNNLGLGLYNNIWVMIVLDCVNISHIILVRTYFFSSISSEMRESAEMDGAGVYTILTKIYVPLAKPVLAVISIYSIVQNWNSWFSANIYLIDTKLQPLQMYLRRILVSQTVNLTDLIGAGAEAYAEAVKNALTAQQMKYAIIVFTTLPILMVYPLFQKYFAKGIMLGSLKG